MARRDRTQFITFLAIFVLFTVYAVRWMLTILTPGLDFQIYFRATQNALNGVSAYLPYDVGTSFVYLPAVLTFLSFLGRLPFQIAFALWSVLSLAAYLIAIGFIFRMVGQVQRWRMVVMVLVLFAPFLETLFVGQINAFVMLLLVLCLWWDEHEQPILAGCCLGIAILLKTSPVLLLPYFFFLRRYRLITTTVLTLIAFSLLAVIQFGTSVYSDYFQVLRNITGGKVELSDYYNPSAAAVTYRLLDALHLTLSGDLITWIWRLFFGGLFLVLMVLLWRNRIRTISARRWLFCALLCIMTMLSPLVWYHHNVFLLLPVALILIRRPRQGLLIALLFQSERLLYNLIPVSVGRVSLDALPLALAATAGTATLVAQCWVLFICIRSAISETQQFAN